MGEDTIHTISLLFIPSVLEDSLKDLKEQVREAMKSKGEGFVIIRTEKEVPALWKRGLIVKGSENILELLREEEGEEEEKFIKELMGEEREEEEEELREEY